MNINELLVKINELKITDWEEVLTLRDHIESAADELIKERRKIEAKELELNVIYLIVKKIVKIGYATRRIEKKIDTNESLEEIETELMRQEECEYQ